MLNSGFIDLILSTTIELVDFARLREYIWLLEFIAFIIAIIDIPTKIQKIVYHIFCFFQ